MRRWRWLSMVAVILVVVSPPLRARNLSHDEAHIARVIRQVVFIDSFSGGVQRGPRPGGFLNSGGCFCVPLVRCSSVEQIRQGCSLPSGGPGVCCPFPSSTASAPGVSKPVFSSPSFNVPLTHLHPARVNEACHKGLQQVNSINQLEQDLIRNNMVLPQDSPASVHLRVFEISKRAKRMDEAASAILAASSNMLTDFNLTPKEGGFGLRGLQVSSTTLAHTCPRNPFCDPNSKYRTADGSCNNLKHPTWGQSNTPCQRIMAPTYRDGVSSPRTTSSDGSPLPNERLISNSVILDFDNPDQTFTLSVMQWAQIMDHDVAHVPFPTMENGDGIQCCVNGQEVTGRLRHPRCWPIDTRGDPLMGSQGGGCMNFVRSMVGVGAGSDCTFGYAEQLNQLTHWIDGSTVYGSDVDQQRALREFRNGRLKTSGNNLLPINPKQSGNCGERHQGVLCYLAGDSRVNEQPGLTAIHILWMRQHNLVARDLQALNPQWSDEAVFQETRRIIIAQIQHITYNEWLPIIVGDSFMNSFGIRALSSGYSFDYNPNFNPSMNNEFSTAAFRFGHTLVQGTMRLFSASGGVASERMRDHFNSPHLIQTQGLLDDIVRSFTQLPIQSFDPFVTHELSNHLFQTPKFTFGMDLMSLNLHRGRDHGIATYNDMRDVCGLPRARTFSDITDQISPDVVQRLSTIYKTVDDIDFFVGGLVERSVSGGLLGWTFLCVVGDQFARLRKGDRFFYDLGGQPGSFTEPQLEEIRRTSWARVICDNANVPAVQPLAFRQANTRLNQPVSCQGPNIPRPNLLLWRGERPAA